MRQNEPLSSEISETFLDVISKDLSPIPREGSAVTIKHGEVGVGSLLCLMIFVLLTADKAVKKQADKHEDNTKH